jgi:hypothetical protein
MVGWHPTPPPTRLPALLLSHKPHSILLPTHLLLSPPSFPVQSAVRCTDTPRHQQSQIPTNSSSQHELQVCGPPSEGGRMFVRDPKRRHFRQRGGRGCRRCRRQARHQQCPCPDSWRQWCLRRRCPIRHIKPRLVQWRAAAGYFQQLMRQAAVCHWGRAVLHVTRLGPRHVLPKHSR